MRSASRRFLVASAGVLAAGVAVAGSWGVCLAQAPAASAPAKFEPYYAAAVRDGVELRAGGGVFYYPVATLKSGARVRVTGEETGFLRVQIAEGLKACIRVGDASLESGGTKVRLTQSARLLHANLSGGVPFCPIGFEREPAAGAEFKLIDTLKGGDGKAIYYVVPAPEGASAFVARDAVRRLTPEEVAAMDAAPASSPGAMTPGESTPGTSASPAPTTPAAVSTEPAPMPPVPAIKPDPRAAEIDSLVATFKRVQAQPAGEAELEPAIAEFKTFIARLGDSPADRRLASRLESYQEVMQLRLDVRNALGKGASDGGRVEQMEQSIVRIREQIINIERQGFFKVIGRLLPSTVYDGERLPKLYRVVSPEPGAGRTLAYILPRAELDLDAKLGRIVGVAGDSKMDESLKANLVTPKRVEVLNLTPAAAPAGAAGDGAPFVEIPNK
ncbi:MAG: hypothetical protein AB7K52_05580 [Phycisphaerales bacterium]